MTNSKSIKYDTKMKNLKSVYETLKKELAKNQQVIEFFWDYGNFEEGGVDSEDEADYVKLNLIVYRTWGQKDERVVDEIISRIGNEIGNGGPCVWPDSDGNCDGGRIYGWTQKIHDN